MTPFTISNRRTIGETRPATHRIDSDKLQRFYHPYGYGQCDRCGAPRKVVENPWWTPDCLGMKTSLGECMRRCIERRDYMRRRLADYELDSDDEIYNSVAMLFGESE